MNRTTLTVLAAGAGLALGVAIGRFSAGGLGEPREL